MTLVRIERAGAVFLTACLAACAAAEPPDAGAAESAAREPIGLMSSLPIYWPLGADLTTIASGEVETSIAREVIEERFVIEPLDTLSPIPSIKEGEPDRDPLEKLKQIAIIQPRGLSPADNVAIDAWVRGGGHLLLALDPALTGHYELPIGDPRYPSATALIPPVVARWGLEIWFDDEQALSVKSASLPGGDVPLELAGEVRPRGDAEPECVIDESRALVQCTVGDGKVTVLADAAVFERTSQVHPEEEDHEHTMDEHDAERALTALLVYAFPENQP